MRPPRHKIPMACDKNATITFMRTKTMVFRSVRGRRELAHGQLGMVLLQRVQADVAEIAKVEQHPRMEGRQMLMVIAPK